MYRICKQKFHNLHNIFYSIYSPLDKKYCSESKKSDNQQLCDIKQKRINAFNLGNHLNIFFRCLLTDSEGVDHDKYFKTFYIYCTSYEILLFLSKLNKIE